MFFPVISFLRALDLWKCALYSRLIFIRMQTVQIRLAWTATVRLKHSHSQHPQKHHSTQINRWCMLRPPLSPVHPMRRMHNWKICQKQRFYGIYSFHKLAPTIPTQTNHPINWIGDPEILQINPRVHSFYQFTTTHSHLYMYTYCTIEMQLRISKNLKLNLGWHNAKRNIRKIYMYENETMFVSSFQIKLYMYIFKNDSFHFRFIKYW